VTATEEPPEGRKTIRLRSLRAVFSREVLREDAPAYLGAHRYSSAAQVYELFRDLSRESKEHFVCLHLDVKHRLLCFDRVAVGTLDGSLVHPREVFKGALLSSAASVVLLHNHPSGDPAPSAEDREVTRKLVEAGKLVGVPVLDHVIVGDGAFYSFSEQGLL
jgi:DNA repair protein RadC